LSFTSQPGCTELVGATTACALATDAAAWGGAGADALLIGIASPTTAYPFTKRSPWLRGPGF